MGQTNLPSIKQAVTDILNAANTTTGSPIDLSLNLTSRVKKVLQINIERLPIQPSFFPCVTMFYDNKQVELADIAGSLRVGRRFSEIDLKIVGLVWIDNMNTSNFDIKDLADNECEQLMENVEEILRSNPELSGYALKSKIVNVEYHSFPISEDAHMRAGVMTHKITVMY